MLSEKLSPLAHISALPACDLVPSISPQDALPSSVMEQAESVPRVLLCEDDADLRSVMRAFLQHEGYDVLACGDGERALELCHSGVAIDVIISDLDMPKLDGIALAKAVSASHPGLPIILMSGLELDAEESDYVASAGWSFFSKPFTLLDLLAAVHSSSRHAELAHES